jgi:DNA-binding transcriptional regulator YhcF (GntR family)
MADEVRALITSGALDPGQPAPTIAELSGKHGCARQAAAKALRLLADEGLLIRYPGFGYLRFKVDCFNLGARPVGLKTAAPRVGVGV